eukprot:TRINITY_DN3826_c0_g1_i4.p1 TRINITY_DN3826_c0_g1~~TRINITY_DN3826_c0_g1_i4.p1  ORF type:complete len:754 (-),score=151.41 TRINITY_DN3826_c0_g1_i4:356-2617(-)
MGAGTSAPQSSNTNTNANANANAQSRHSQSAASPATEPTKDRKDKGITNATSHANANTNTNSKTSSDAKAQTNANANQSGKTNSIASANASHRASQHTIEGAPLPQISFDTPEELRNRVDLLTRQLELMIAERSYFSHPAPVAQSNWDDDEGSADPYGGPLPEVAVVPQLEEVEADFGKLRLPIEETLDGSWAAVVAQSIPMTGRVYVTKHYVCYRVVVFGMVLTRLMHLSEVSKLQLKDREQVIAMQWRGRFYVHFRLSMKDFREAYRVIDEHVRASSNVVPVHGVIDGYTNSALTVRDVVAMMRGTRVTSHLKDTAILKEGTQYENLYQVLQGRLEVQIGDPSDVVVLRVMQEGDMFGEMSFLEGGAASASVVAADEKSMVCCLEGQYLVKLIQTRPGFGARLHKFLSLVLSDRVKNLSRIVPSLNIGREAGKRSLRRRMSVHDSSTRDLNAMPTYYFVYSEVGKNPSDPFKQNQDNYCVFEVMVQGQKVSFYGVFDGHGSHGHDVSKIVRDRLAQDIFRDVEMFARDPKTAIHRGFLETNKAVLQADFDVDLSGTTAVVVIQIGHKIIIGNVGDSRAILGRAFASGTTADRKKMFEALDLSQDQKPDQPGEMQRIVASGGQVDCFYDENGNPDGPYRVFIAGEGYPGLAMARSIGDGIGKSCGVIADPVITEYTLDRERDRFLVLASDGVWEFLSSQHVVNTVGSMSTPESSCRQLVFDAKQEWDRRSVEEGGYRDDITALVVYLHSHIR